MALIHARDYQLEAIDKIEAAFAAGIHRPAIQMATGGGKTIVFAHLLNKRMPLGQQMVLAHRDELLSQAVDKIHMVAPGLACGIIKAETYQPNYPITVASIQTLSRERRLEGLGNRQYATVVVDEAHHAAAKTYRDVLARVVGPDTLLLGVSATLERTDKWRLDDVFDDVVFDIGMFELMRRGYLVDVRAKRIHIKGEHTLRKTHGDYSENDVEAVLHDGGAPEIAVRAFNTHGKDRKAILFAPTVASAQEFEETFSAAGYRTATVWGAQDLEERRHTLRRFAAGDIDVLCNCMVLTEGFDDPSVDCLIMARMTASRPLYTQMLGRGVRTSIGKQDCLVLDLIGITNTDLVDTATLAGVDPEALEKKTLMQAVAEEEELAEMLAGKRRVEGELIAKEVDVFARQRLKWAWANSGQSRVYTLTAGTETVLVMPADSGAWRVMVAHPAIYNNGHSQKAWEETLEEGLDLGYAQGVAEQYVRDAGALILNDPKRWRGGDKPASEGQLKYLKVLGVKDLDPELTIAAASDLINAAKARQLAQRLAR